MTRNALLHELRGYLPTGLHEAAMVERLLSFVDGEPRCFERTNVAGHVTASAWVLDPARERVLLMHHRKLARWLQFGGHAEGEADVRAVALREAQEESGIHELRFIVPGLYDVDVHDIPAHADEAAHVHYDLRFALEAPAGAAPVVNDESHAVRWFALGDVATLEVDESVLRLLRKTSRLPRR